MKRLQVGNGSPHAHLPTKMFGKAGLWAQHLRADLGAWRAGELPWSEVDKGVLLFGPPGVGKTTFARSLAEECQLHLVATSLGRWQSNGHLGDLLRAMYSDFAEAKAKAPSVLFIDEFDSFGDRSTVKGDNAQYQLEVINAALEALDGAAGREGVIVIGATNLPKRIDPAFLRGGRLERHIMISKPSAIDRALILAHYLPEFASETRLKDIASQLAGQTGADIEFLIRRAKRRARTRSASISLDDVEMELPNGLRMSEDDLIRVSVHEAGHAILATLLDVGRVEYVAIKGYYDYEDDGDDALGRTMLVQPEQPIRTSLSMRNDICMKLGGLVAEEIVFGCSSTTAGGSDESDLARATELAIQMITKFGMGRSLPVFSKDLAQIDGRHLLARHRDIEQLLDVERKRARLALEANQNVLSSLAEALRQHGKLEADRLDHFLLRLAGTGDIAATLPEATDSIESSDSYVAGG